MSNTIKDPVRRQYVVERKRLARESQKSRAERERVRAVRMRRRVEGKR